MEVREALKILRTELDMTQLELANALGVTHKSVSRWELGNSFPQARMADAILRLAKKKGVSDRCIEHLQGAFSHGRKKGLRVPKSKLYPIDRETICQLVDESHHAIYVADMESDKLLYANAKAEEYAGKKFTPGETCYQFLLDRTEPCVDCPKAQMLENESTNYHMISPKNGKRLLVRGRKLNWEGKNAHAQYFFEESTDLEGQGGYQKMMDALDMGICSFWIHDHGRIEMNYMSDGYFDLVDSCREKRARFTGYGAMNAVCEGDQRRVEETAAAAGKAQKSFRMRYCVVRDDGSLKELYMRAKFIKREADKSLYYCTVQDIDGMIS